MSRAQRRIGVVGTGTAVGKTTLTLAWVRHLRRAGVDALAWKALETGGDDDSRALADASEAVNAESLIFSAAESPHRAARREDRTVDFEERAQALSRAATGATHVLVETAGGACTPLTDRGDTNLDMLIRLHARSLVLVARDRLGVLHDVLAVVGSLPEGCTIACIVVNDFDDEVVRHLDNAGELEQLLPAIPIVKTGAIIDASALSELSLHCFT